MSTVISHDKVTPGGIALKPFYRPEDIAGTDYDKDLADPGNFPFARGIYPEMYRHTPWVIQEEVGFDCPEDTLKRGELYKQLGTRHYTMDTFDVYVDCLTQLGIDSDSPGVEYQVGKEGIHIDSIYDMERLLATVDMEKTHLGLVAFSFAPMVYAMLLGVAEKRGVQPAKVVGSINNDPLAGPIGENFLVFPPRGHLRLMIDMVEYSIEHTPRVQPLTVTTYDIREAGANPVQEIAIGLAQAMEIIAYAVERGLLIDKISHCIHFHVQAGDYFFEEVAKLRAMRRMWARILTGHFGVIDPTSARIKYQTHTAGSSLQTKEPLNNVVRAALHTLAAVLGGVQTIHTCAYDEAIAIPAEEAAKLAIRTQQIILEESGVPDVADPLGGSYYVEWLTNQMEKQAWDYIETIQSKGGYLAALESGFLLNEVDNSAMKQQEEITSGRKVIVGVNKHATTEDEEEIELFRHNPGMAERAIERIRLLKERRDQGLIDRRLSELKKTLYENKNVIPFMKEAFLADATNSEVFNVCREVLGEWRPL